MSWASDRLGWLTTQTDWETITQYTGISEAQYDGILSNVYTLTSSERSNLASYYGRTLYALARSSGLSRQVATRLRSQSVSRATEYIAKSNAYISDLVEYRLPKYIEYRRSEGDTRSEAELRSELYDAIATSAGKSRKNNSEDFWKNSPTLNTILSEGDDEE